MCIHVIHDVVDAQKRVSGSVCMCMFGLVFVCTTDNTYIKQRERGVDATQALMESFTLLLYSTVLTQVDATQTT